MTSAAFHVVYDGPALASHEMDVRDLAPALLALGEVFENANRVLNGNRAKVSVRVKASFETGCFGIDLTVIQSILDQTIDFLISRPVSGALSLAALIGVVNKGGKGLIWLIQRLRGRIPSKIEYLSDGRCRLLVDQETFEVEREVIELLKDFRTRKAIEAAIAEPLKKEGIETVAFKANGEPFLLVEKQESAYFEAPPPEDAELAEYEDIVTLQLISPAFREGNKWEVCS